MSRMVSIFLILFLLTIGCGKSAPTIDQNFLDQGWNAENNFRELSYYTSQGSRLIPYKWFLALEQPNNEELFKDPKYIESMGFLTPSAEEIKTYKRNPDGLPIGFVRDPPFEEGRDEFDKMDFMGFNCSACHTGQIQYKGKAIRIDGGPTMADLQTFLERMSKSLQETAKDKAKFDRFAEKVKSPDKKTLKEDLKIFSDTFSDLVKRGVNPVFKPGSENTFLRYGYARLDAFGGILNEVAHNLGKLGKKAKLGSPDAPVSYPFIWDAPKLEWVQWNGAVNNPIARNAGEVVGVFGKIVPNEKTLLTSSARLENLFELEEWLHKLKSPKWPKEILSELDADKINRGKTIYEGGTNEQGKKYKGCIGCHKIHSLDPDSTKGWTAKGKYIAGKQFIKITMVSVEKVGTDPKMAENFARRTFEVGPLAQAPTNDWESEDKKSALEVLGEFVTITIAQHLKDLKANDPQKFLKYIGYRVPQKNSESEPEKSPSLKYKLRAYKARPLNGIWATAPYLHNGSVPNLYQLLSPSDRKEKFCVGSREFDPKNVGFEFGLVDGKCEENSTLFDTTLPGNSNAGHDYAKDLEKDERMDLLEFLKNLRPLGA